MLRPALRTDVPAMLAIYSPYVLTSTATFEYDPPSLDEFYRRYDTYTTQFPWLLWEEEGEVLGYAYAAPPYSRPAYSWCAEPTIYLKPQARGRGIGPRLYEALEDILAQQGYQVLYALVSQENTASQVFHERAGYGKQAFFPNCGYKFDRWIGLYWMEKRLCPVKTPNGFPTPWKTVVQNVERFESFLDVLSLS